MVAPTGRKPGRTPMIQGAEALPDYSEDGIPKAPTVLKVDGKKMWKTIWEVGSWIDRKQSYQFVLRFCEKFDAISALKKELDYLKNEQKIKLKMAIPISTYQQANGSWAPFPQVRLINEAEALLVSWLIELRMTPTSTPDNSDADDILNAIRQKNPSA